MAEFNQVSRKSLRAEIRELIRNAIMKGLLKPGERIVESQIAKQMGVSQAPVREALRELEQEGLVITYPHRGASVREITKKDIYEIYSLRAVLERFAVELQVPEYRDEDFHQLETFIRNMITTAQKGDTEAFVEADFNFHAYICRCAGHELLYKTWLGISPMNWTAFTASRQLHPTVELAERHIPVFDALRSRDPQVAGEAIWHHIWDLGEEIIASLHENKTALEVAPR